MQGCWKGIGLVLLAAGRGTRFGTDKLAAPLLGRPLVDHAARIGAELPLARRVAVLGPFSAPLPCTGYAEVRLATPDQPQSASLAFGIEALGETGLEGVLVLLGDMPLVTRAHLDALFAAFDGTEPVCSQLGDAHCPPALFPVAMLPVLAGQNGDRGARALLRDAVTVAAGEDVLLDIDRAEDLFRAEDVLRARSA